MAKVLLISTFFHTKVRQGIHRLLSETDSGDQTEEGAEEETEEGDQETERRVVGGFAVDAEQAEEGDDEEESGSIDLEQQPEGLVGAMGCVSRDLEEGEGGNGAGTDSGIDRTTVGSSRVGSAEGWLARLSSR